MVQDIIYTSEPPEDFRQLKLCTLRLVGTLFIYPLPN